MLQSTVVNPYLLLLIILVIGGAATVPMVIYDTYNQLWMAWVLPYICICQVAIKHYGSIGADASCFSQSCSREWAEGPGPCGQLWMSGTGAVRLQALLVLIDFENSDLYR